VKEQVLAASSLLALRLPDLDFPRRYGPPFRRSIQIKKSQIYGAKIHESASCILLILVKY